MQHKYMKQKKQRKKTAVIVCFVFIFAATAGVFLFIDYINKQRTKMHEHLEAAVIFTEHGAYIAAQTEAEEALLLANKLRDDETADISEKIIVLISMLLNANEYFDSGSYEAALEAYKNALSIAESLENLNTELIESSITDTEMYISFYTLISEAEALADVSEFETAISAYEEAKQIAVALSYTEGIGLTEAGIEEMHQLIIKAKRAEAENLFLQGEAHFYNKNYSEALICFYSALEIYMELDDKNLISFLQTRIDYTAHRLAEAERPDPVDPDDAPDDTLDDTPDDAQGNSDEEGEVLLNYDHNIGIYFDLQTLIDYQNRRPANLIRMGTREGMNEGWYNGCSWVAVYNSLILLNNPKHPADIVRYFEESGGTVLGGVFGTYPNAIVDYMRSLEYNVTHTLFPQITKNLDDEIKSSRVSILAYAHTSAAHYITIEYNEDIDKFIIYNDSFARARSDALGFGNITSAGAAVDSVTALISNTRDILFSFSLIIIG